MSSSNIRLSLEVDAESIDIRQLLQKDFLELSMKAISSANPNRNNSWFTRESMEESIGTFVNKPVLGYFENGDFVSHNGEWEYDSETELEYWDTLGKKGERILGVIRESDTVKIVDGADGLSWIVFTCALWTQYSFKQVKRLIKDAKRAQKTGKAVKNISVEVDIIDYEELPNGVMKINKFNLVGVTILGSRNGVPVEPGIENAELSVVDILGRELYSKQEQSLRLAYEKLDNPTAEPKEVQKMEEKDVVVDQATENQTQHLEETSGETDDNCKLSDEVCPECGKNPCECSAEGKKEDEEGKACEGEGEEGTNCKASADEGDDGDDGDDPDDDGDESKKDPEDEDGKKDDECKMSEGANAEFSGEVGFVEGGEDLSKEHVLCDAAWLLQSAGWNVDDISRTIAFYENSTFEYKDYVIAVLSRIKERLAYNIAELGELVGNLAIGISDEMRAAEQEKEKYESINVVELSAKYDACCAEKDAALAKVADFEHKEFVAAAKAMISSVQMSEDDAAAFVEKCESFEIKDADELKSQLAMYVFDHREAKDASSETHASFSAGVESPNTTSWTKKQAKSNKPSDPWSRLREYNNGGAALG